MRLLNDRMYFKESELAPQSTIYTLYARGFEWDTTYPTYVSYYQREGDEIWVRVPEWALGVFITYPDPPRVCFYSRDNKLEWKPGEQPQGIMRRILSYLGLEVMDTDV